MLGILQTILHVDPPAQEHGYPVVLGSGILDAHLKSWIQALSCKPDTAMVVGSLLGICLVPSLEVALFIYGCCCVFDDIGWIVVYHKTRSLLLARGEDGEKKDGRGEEGEEL